MSTAPVLSTPGAALRRYGVAMTALLAAAYSSLGLTGGLAALKAAGVTGSAPQGAAGFEKLIGTLNDNLLWLFVTCIGIAVIVGGVLMALGHSRAQDHLIRIGGGVIVVLVLAPSIVA